MSKKKKQNIQSANQIKSCTLYVDGMHCASCEILIEKKLLKQDGVESVDASLKNNKVEINYIGSSKPDIDSLNQEFSSQGYTFSDKKFKRKDVPLISFKNGNLVINPEKMNSLFRVGIVFISLIVAFFIFENLQLGKYVSVDATSSLPAFFLLGLVAGLSSCAALVGGLLLSMIKQWNELYIDSDSNTQKAQPHIMFHIGRLISFFILGGVLGLIGSAVSFDNPVVFSILTILISLVMLVLAMQMLGVEWAQNFRFTAPKFLTRFAADETNFQGKQMPFITGILTFFLPCGFTLIAQTIALTSGSFLHGSLVMLFFALGTLPMLMGISLSGLKFNSKPHLTAKFNTIAGLVIVFFVLYNINGQLNVLGYPSLSDISFGGGEASAEQTTTANNQGEQVINITAEGFSYNPTGSTTIKAGVPTVLVVNNKGMQGCGVFMTARGLFDGYKQLKSGENRISFTPQKGTYKLTCSMGMVPPVTITVI